METFTEDQVLLIEIRQPEISPGGATQALGGPVKSGGPIKSGGPVKLAGSGNTGSRAVAMVTAEQVMRLISGRNVELLQLIKQRQPQSLAELARISGRPTASLTRTLQRLSALGIVVMRKSKGREKIPTVACDCLRFELALTSPGSSSTETHRR